MYHTNLIYFQYNSTPSDTSHDLVLCHDPWSARPFHYAPPSTGENHAVQNLPTNLSNSNLSKFSDRCRGLFLCRKLIYCRQCHRQSKVAIFYNFGQQNDEKHHKNSMKTARNSPKALKKDLKSTQKTNNLKKIFDFYPFFSFQSLQ